MLQLKKKCMFCQMKKKQNIAAEGFYLKSHIIVTFLSHEMKFPYIESLDLIFYGTELNPVLQISGQSSKVKVSQTDITNIFFTHSRNCSWPQNNARKFAPFLL